MNYLGIDPGKSGGLALLASDGTVIDCAKMPESERDLLDLLEEWKAIGLCRAVLELVRSSPQMGVTSAFTFGRGYGSLRTAIIAAGIPFVEAAPSKWQVGFGLPSTKKAGSQPAKKRAHKLRAQEMFPSVKVTHALADALLIAEFCRRTK